MGGGPGSSEAKLHQRPRAPGPFHGVCGTRQSYPSVPTAFEPQRKGLRSMGACSKASATLNPGVLAGPCLGHWLRSRLPDLSEDGSHRLIWYDRNKARGEVGTRGLAIAWPPSPCPSHSPNLISRVSRLPRRSHDGPSSRICWRHFLSAPVTTSGGHHVRLLVISRRSYSTSL